MQTLQIDKKKARKLYPSASNEFKEMLHDSFGKEFFSTNPMDRIKTWEDACEDQGLDPVEALPYKKPANEHEEAINGFAQMCIIAKALNGDWKGDLSDDDQPKYYPWFERSGSALSYDVCVLGRVYELRRPPFISGFGNGRICRQAVFAHLQQIHLIT